MRIHKIRYFCVQKHLLCEPLKNFNNAFVFLLIVICIVEQNLDIGEFLKQDLLNPKYMSDSLTIKIGWLHSQTKIV